ncbi:MAG: hypothetical protein K2P86_00640 [Xanthobacteraceae bacterium]|nr:hypothetical protein [Xanthobacteraceae bacterium]
MISSHIESKDICMYGAVVKLRGKLCIGFRLHLRDKVVESYGWIWSNQNPYGQMLALQCVLRAIADDDREFTLRAVFRTAQVRIRLEQALERAAKKQFGRPVRQAREDEAGWYETALLYKQHCRGITPAFSEVDLTELKKIEREIENQVYQLKGGLSGSDPVMLACVLPGDDL